MIDPIMYPVPDEPAIEDYEGTPYIRGTRMKVRLIAEEMRAGSSILNILEAHPHLTIDQVRAALGYYRAHQQEIDTQIDDLHRRSEELRPTGQTPSR